MSSRHVLTDEQEEQIAVLNQMREEASTPKPHTSLLKLLGNGLLATLKTLPDVAQAASAVVPVVTHGAS
jgi:hypothetical protein